MKLPPLVAAVPRWMGVGPNPVGPTPGVVAAAQLLVNYDQLELWAQNEHRESIEVYRLGQGHSCNHGSGQPTDYFWSECVNVISGQPTGVDSCCHVGPDGAKLRCQYTPSFGSTPEKYSCVTP
jgi:hypothetical protein